MFSGVAIVGVGLIGASIGLALKQRRLCRYVLGIGHRRETLETARMLGAIDELALEPGSRLEHVDLVVVCTPVDQIVASVRAAAPYLSAGTVVTDAGSAKERIVAELDSNGLVFVGSHPLAGSEKRGPEAAHAELFDGRLCVITPTERTPPGAVERVQQFWEALGMTVVTRAPAEHDRLLARTSHVPHLAASALALLLGPAERPFAATGFRDTTRIAAGDPKLWGAICRHNRQAILDGLDDLTAALSRLRTALDQEDYDTLERLLHDAKLNRDALGN